MTLPFSANSSIGPKRGSELSPKERNCFMALLSIAGLGVYAIATSPIWLAAAGAFLISHPTIPATAFVAVVKAIASNENPIAAGAKAGIEKSAVELIATWVKKYMKFL